MGDINTPDFSLSDLNVDGDILMKDVGSDLISANNTNENEPTDVPFVIDSIQGNYTEIDEPLTTEDILKTINDITEKADENVDPLESDEIEKTLQQTEATSDFVYSTEERSQVSQETDIVEGTQENSAPPEIAGVNEGQVSQETDIVGGTQENSAPPEIAGVNEVAEDKVEEAEETADDVPVAHDEPVAGDVPVASDVPVADDVPVTNTETLDTTTNEPIAADVPIADDVPVTNNETLDTTTNKGDTNKVTDESADPPVLLSDPTEILETELNEENTKDLGDESGDKTDDKTDDNKNASGEVKEASPSENSTDTTPLPFLNGKEAIDNMKQSLNKLLNANADGGKSVQNGVKNSSGASVDRETALKNRERQFSKEKMELDVIGSEAGILPEQVPSPLTTEEITLKTKMFSSGYPAVQFVKLHCTACNVHLGSSIENQHLRYVHPVLKVLICKDCYLFYTSGDFDKDEDGYELYCRWCGQGGNVMCCSYCEFVFCKKCIRNNLGKKKLDSVKNSDDWICCVCDPSQIMKQKATLVALFEYTIQELKRISATNCPELRSNDYTTCCHDRIKQQQIKRTSTDEAEKPKKRAKKVPKVEAPEQENEDKYFKQFDFADSIWASTTEMQETQQEEEVVCAPDLSMLMEEDDNTPKSQSESPTTTISSDTSMPPLTSASSILSTQLMMPLSNTSSSNPSPTPSYLRVKNVSNLLPDDDDDDVQIVEQTETAKPAVVKPRVPNNVQNYQRVRLIQPKNNAAPNSLNLPPFIRIASKPNSKKQPIILNTYAMDGRKQNVISTVGTLQPIKNFPNAPRFLRAPSVRAPPVKATAIRTPTVRPTAIRTPAVRPQAIRTQMVRPVLSTATTNTTQVNNVSYVSNIPARLIPNLKHEWYDSTVNVTTEVYMGLAKSLTDLGQEKNSAKSIADLANVHNKLQEVLSTSINTLIQVRRNLRTEFIKGLSQIKENKQMGLQNNDVIVVAPNSSSPITNPPPLIIPSTSIMQPSSSMPVSSVTASSVLISTSPNFITIPSLTIPTKPAYSTPNNTQTSSSSSNSDSVILPPLVPYNQNKPMGYLKVKSVSQLLNVPSECITIPDLPKSQIPALLPNGTPIILNKLSETPVLKKIPEDDDILETTTVTPTLTNTVADLKVIDVRSLSDSPNDSNDISVNTAEKSEDNKTDENISDEVRKPSSSAKSKEEFEKGIRRMMDENLKKYNYPVNLSVRELKYMLSARVHVQDMCKMNILDMLTHRNSNADLLKEVNKTSIGRLKKKLTSKLRIGRVRNRNSRTSLYTIIHSPNNTNSASNSDTENEGDNWSPCSGSESENVISD